MSIKIKAKAKKGVVTAKVMAKHAMLSNQEAKRAKKEANWITHMVAKVGDEIVFEATTSQFLSKNPYIKFYFKGEKGEKLTFSWVDLSGKSKTETKKIR